MTFISLLVRTKNSAEVQASDKMLKFKKKWKKDKQYPEREVIYKGLPFTEVWEEVCLPKCQNYNWYGIPRPLKRTG